MAELDKEAIKEVIEGMLDGFDKEHLESPMFKRPIEKSEYLKDPDTMKTMILHPFMRCVELAISKTQNKSN